MDYSGTPAEPRVAVVLVNWNGWRECVECIDSLLAQDHRNFHVFIVDNDSQDGSIDKIVSWCAAPTADAAWRSLPGVSRLTDQPQVSSLQTRITERADRGLPSPPDGCRLTLIRSGGNLGFAGGCNVGIRAAGLGNFDYFWFLNPDTVVDRGALVALIDRAEDEPGVGIVGATLRYYDQPDIIQALGGASLDRSNGTSRHIGQGTPLRDAMLDAPVVERDMAYVMGACMLVRRSFIAEVGLMEEDYFLYYEEIDWALRGTPRFSLGFAPRSHVFHKSGANSSKVMPLFTAGFYYRNRLRFVARFLPERLGAAKWSLFDGMMRHVANGRWGHARVILTTLLTAGRITADVTRKR
jgi:GT2 family glycosyltransferase